MVDGSKFEFFANGIRVDTMATGEVVETHPDGTVLRRKIESNVCVACSQCQTIINASKGHFIVCCPICRHIMLANQVCASGLRAWVGGVGEVVDVGGGLVVSPSLPLPPPAAAAVAAAAAAAAAAFAATTATAATTTATPPPPPPSSISAWAE